MPEKLTSIEETLAQKREERERKEQRERKETEIKDKKQRYETSLERVSPVLKERDDLVALVDSLNTVSTEARSSLEGYKTAKGKLDELFKKFGDDLKYLGITNIDDLLKSGEFGQKKEAVIFKESKEKVRASGGKVIDNRKLVKDFLPDAKFNSIDTGGLTEKTMEKIQARIGELNGQVSSIEGEKNTLETELKEMCRAELEPEKILSFQKPNAIGGLYKVYNWGIEHILPENMVNRYGKPIAELVVRDEYSRWVANLIKKLGAKSEDKDNALVAFDLRLALYNISCFMSSDRSVAETIDKERDKSYAEYVLTLVNEFRKYKKDTKIFVKTKEDYRNYKPEISIQREVDQSILENKITELEKIKKEYTALSEELEKKEASKPMLFGKAKYEDELKRLKLLVNDKKVEMDGKDKSIKTEQEKIIRPVTDPSTELGRVFEFKRLETMFTGWHTLGDYLDKVEKYCKSRITFTPEEVEKLKVYDQLRKNVFNCRDIAIKHGIDITDVSNRISSL